MPAPNAKPAGAVDMRSLRGTNRMISRFELIIKLYESLAGRNKVPKPELLNLVVKFVDGEAS